MAEQLNPDQTGAKSGPSTSRGGTGSAGSADTRERLLDAAERLFAEHGPHRASLRAITREAEANLAAVNYHFGGKEALLREVLARRLRPLNRRRLELLDKATQGPAAPSVEEILRALVAPVLTMVEREPGGHRFARFLTRTFSEPDPSLRRIVLAEFEEVIQRFTQAIAEARPELSKEEIFWRFWFTVGAMAHTTGFGFLIQELSGGSCDPLDVENVTQRLVSFVAAGTTAPATGSRGGRE